MECSVQAHGFQRPATWIPTSRYMDSSVQQVLFFILIFLYSYILMVFFKYVPTYLVL